MRRSYAMRDAAEVQRSERLSTVDRLSTQRGQGPFRGQRVAHRRNVR